MENTQLKNAQDLWQPLSKAERDADKIVRPSMTYWQDVWRRLKGNKVAMGSLIFLVFLILVAIFVPMFWHTAILTRIL